MAEKIAPTTAARMMIIQSKTYEKIRVKETLPSLARDLIICIIAVVEGGQNNVE
jgi:hypothetical protein